MFIGRHDILRCIGEEEIEIRVSVCVDYIISGDACSDN